MSEAIKTIDTDEMINRLDEIALEKVELEEAILGIELKLEETKINQMTLGIMPDTSWLYRAKHALGIKKIQLKKLNIEYSKLNRVLKKERIILFNERVKDFRNNFIKAAKEILSDEEYERIKILANEITDNKNDVDTSKEVESNVVRKGAPWSKEDEEYLKSNYKNSTIEELSLTLGRSENAIRSKIQVIKKRL